MGELAGDRAPRWLGRRPRRFGFRQAAYNMPVPRKGQFAKHANRMPDKGLAVECEAEKMDRQRPVGAAGRSRAASRFVAMSQTRLHHERIRYAGILAEAGIKGNPPCRQRSSAHGVADVQRQAIRVPRQINSQLEFGPIRSMLAASSGNRAGGRWFDRTQFC